MLFVDIVNHSPMSALEKMLSFTEARHRVLTENIANVDTPGYQSKHLDVQAFQKSLSQAIEKQKESHSARLELDGTNQFSQDGSGRLIFTPEIEPAENILFHDKTNGRIEKQMAMLAENAMMHQAATELLRERFQGLMKAIRGRVV